MEQAEVMGQVQIGLEHIADGDGRAFFQQRAAPVLPTIADLLRAE